VIFHLDPLTHLYLLVTRQSLQSIGWAIAAFVLWAILGRIFCGWICPLGAMLDFSRWFVERFQALFDLIPQSKSAGSIRKARRSPVAFRPDTTSLHLPGSLNLWLLGVLITLAAFRMPLLWVFDPIVLSFKFLTVALYPALDRPVRALYLGLDSKLYDNDFWYPINQFFNRFVLPYREPTYIDALLIVTFVLILFVLQWHHRRWWCKYICPLGALLRISYFFSPVKRRVAHGCTACTLCEVECHFSGDDVHDCMYCMSCIERCPERKVTFLPGAKLASFADSNTENVGSTKSAAAEGKSEKREKANRLRAKIEGINMSKPSFNRRAFLGSVATGVVVYPFLELFNQKIRLPIDFIRPPGALPEKDFLDRCIKCGQCLKVCLTNGLQPALFEAGLDGLWTPRLISRMGCCEFECNMCGQVCPTGAIAALTLEKKKEFIIGTAYFDTDRCIPFVTDKSCIVCEEHCPTSDKAIKFHNVVVARDDGSTYESKQPYVIQDLCIGCGICEFVCPLDGESAVRVFRVAPKLGTGDTGGAESAGEYGSYGVYEGYGSGEYPKSASGASGTDGVEQPIS